MVEQVFYGPTRHVDACHVRGCVSPRPYTRDLFDPSRSHLGKESLLDLRRGNLLVWQERPHGFDPRSYFHD